MRNQGFMGKNMPVKGTANTGMYDIDDLYFNKYDTSFGLGYLYALSYVSTTGGTLTTYTGASGSDITTTIESYYGNTSGDALFLPAGTYYMKTSSATDSSKFLNNYGQSIFCSGFYGVFGSHPDSTIIIADEDGSNRTDNCVISWDDAGDIKIALGYFTLLTKSYGSASYLSALFHGTGTTDLTYCSMKNVAINRDNTNLTMLYDNNNDTGYIELINCSLGNVLGFAGNYSGSLSNKDAYNCLFEPNVTTSEWGTLTDTTVNGSYFTVDGDGFMDYDDTTYTDRGHRYNLNDTTWSSPGGL